MTKYFSQLMDMPSPDNACIGLPRRLAATILDILVVSICYVMAFLLILEVARALGSFAALFLSGRLAVYFLFIAALFYFPVLESSSMQATIGKYLLQIKVTDVKGQRARFTTVLLRNILKLISLTTVIGVLIIPFTKRKQSLHDMICGTVVVRAEPRGKAQDY